MTDTIRIEVVGMKEVLSNLDKLGPDLPRYLQGAGIEISNDILDIKGLRNYPPATDANVPPTPYYIRGRGTQYASRNDGSSERLGTRWETRRSGQTGIEIRNPASYAEHVHGTKQARAMGAIGWRILEEVAKERIKNITEIYNKWINKLLVRMK